MKYFIHEYNVYYVEKYSLRVSRCKYYHYTGKMTGIYIGPYVKKQKLQ